MRTSHPRRFPRSPLNHTGFTLVEVMIAVVVGTVATYILSSSVTSAVSSTVTRQQRAVAAEGAMNRMELIRATPVDAVFALFNADPTDDPGGVGTAPGPHFSVDGLPPVLDEDGEPLPIGTVLLPGLGAVLDETLEQPEFGLPRDLDGDLEVRPGDCSRRYLVLPVTVRIRWRSRLGDRSLELSTLLVDLEKITR